MLNVLFVFIGAGIGGVLRYWVSTGTYLLLGRQFPYGTLVVNVTGSFVMGFLFVMLLNRFGELAPMLRTLLLIGLLGGYTTFSSFSMETMLLIESGANLSALLNIVLSVILCIGACWLGIVIGRL